MLITFLDYFNYAFAQASFQKTHDLLFGLKKRQQRRSANGGTDLPETRRSWH